MLRLTECQVLENSDMSERVNNDESDITLITHRGGVDEEIKS